MPSQLERTPGWSSEHLGAFIDEVKGDRFFALWMLAATTGLPLETSLGLRRSDLDLQERRIAPGFDAPTDESPRSSFGLDPDTYDAVREHVIAWDKERHALHQDTHMLFVWSNGQPLDAGSAMLMFEQHCAQADVPSVPLDQIRVAYAIAALESGIPTRVIHERLSREEEPRMAPVIPLMARRTRDGQSIEASKADGPAHSTHDRQRKTRRATYRQEL